MKDEGRMLQMFMEQLCGPSVLGMLTSHLILTAALGRNYLHFTKLKTSLKKSLDEKNIAVYISKKVNIGHLYLIWYNVLFNLYNVLFNVQI